MDFPRHCHKPEGLFVVVGDEAQYAAVTANGWTDQPEAHVEKPVEVRYVDALASDAKPSDPVEEPKKRGRPAKG